MEPRFLVYVGFFLTNVTCVWYTQSRFEVELGIHNQLYFEAHLSKG